MSLKTAALIGIIGLVIGLLLGMVSPFVSMLKVQTLRDQGYTYQQVGFIISSFIAIKAAIPKAALLVFFSALLAKQYKI